jgi:hypothetical protein
MTDYFIIYDQIWGYHEDCARSKFYSTLIANASKENVFIFNDKSLFQPANIDSVKAVLYLLSMERDSKIHVLILNGVELGCRYFYDLLKLYNLHQNVLFIDECLSYSKNRLRFMSEPTDKVIDLGFSDFASDWFKENLNKNEVIEFAEGLADPLIKKTKTIKNRVSVISQPSIRLTFNSLKAPYTEYPLLVKNFLQSKYKNDFKDLEILWHLHPWEKETKTSGFDPAGVGLRAKIMDGETLEEVTASEVIIGWDSSFLVKAFYSGFETYSLKNEHTLNFSKDKFLVSSKIQTSSFIMEKSGDRKEYETFLKKKELYEKLSSPNNPKFTY